MTLSQSLTVFELKAYKETISADIMLALFVFMQPEGNKTSVRARCDSHV